MVCGPSTTPFLWARGRCDKITPGWHRFRKAVCAFTIHGTTIYWVGESGKCYFKRYEEEFVLLRGVCAGSNVALPHRPMPIFPNERRLSQSFNVVAQTRCPTPQTLSAGLCFGSCPASRDVAVSRPVLPPLNNVLCIPNRFFSIIFAKLQAQRPTLATGKPVCCPSRGCRRRQQR